MTFNRHDGELVRKWWQERCIEWCYARFEDGKFGDQKYLDDWETRFKAQVHVLKNKELILAPWNATRFQYGNSAVWHFQGLRVIRKRASFYAYFGFYKLPNTTRTFIYLEYLKDLGHSIGILKGLNHNVRTQGRLTKWQTVKDCLFRFLVMFKFPLQLNVVEIGIPAKESERVL